MYHIEDKANRSVIREGNQRRKKSSWKLRNTYKEESKNVHVYQMIYLF